MRKSTVLFLCTANSCRSQLAEAIVNARLGGQWIAFSAGSRPSSQVHPLVLQVLAEIGIEHHGRPKSMQQFYGRAFDLVVTLCDDSSEDCPVWLGRGKKVYRPFPDPTKATGSDSEILQEFRKVRDEIAGVVPTLLNRN